MVNDKSIAIRVAILIIQKNFEPKKVNIFLFVGFSILATKSLKNGAKKLANKCAILTDPNAIAAIIIKSVKEGFRFIFSVNVETFSFKLSIAEVSALSHLFILFRLPIPISNIAIQILATTISTKTIPPYNFWL